MRTMSPKRHASLMPDSSSLAKCLSAFRGVSSLATDRQIIKMFPELAFFDTGWSQKLESGILKNSAA